MLAQNDKMDKGQDDGWCFVAWLSREAVAHWDNEERGSGCRWNAERGSNKIDDEI